MGEFAKYVAFSAALALLVGCARERPMVPASGVLPEQQIVDRSADALQGMRNTGRFPALDSYLARAKGVMIFPRVIKAGLLFGGQGGNGVLVARRSNGSWSAPAFYSMGGGSAGLQIGFQQATVVLCFMNESALLSAINQGVTLGTDVSVAAGTMGNAGKATRKTTAKDIYQFVNVGGVFAGVSLAGIVVSSRESFNRDYYGPTATTYGIVLGGRYEHPGTASLRQALLPSAASEERR